jgi:hypothetical protein
MQNVRIRNAAVGMKFVNRLACPPISEEKFASLAGEQPEYVTRHIEAKYYDAALKGYFRIGTLYGYRASETAAKGRLGDHEESRQEDTINAENGKFKAAKIAQNELRDCEFDNVERQIVIETSVNDYCSCSSIGEFNSERLQALKDSEQDPAKKPEAYVTYHLPTLRSALKAYVECQEGLGAYELYGSPVEYGQKDRQFQANGAFQYHPGSDPVETWFTISFLKSPDFSREEEYRLLLIDPQKPGSLPVATDVIVIPESPAIAEAIHSSACGL